MGMGFAPTWLRQVSPLLHKTTLTTVFLTCQTLRLLLDNVWKGLCVRYCLCVCVPIGWTRNEQHSVVSAACLSSPSVPRLLSRKKPTRKKHGIGDVGPKSAYYSLNNNAPTLTSCSFHKHGLILIIFGTDSISTLSKMTCLFNLNCPFSLTYFIRL